MAPQFALAVRYLKNFFVNSEKTAAELRPFARKDARIRRYRPTVANQFALDTSGRSARPAKPSPLKLVSLGTVEPRKNYGAALAILDAVRARIDSSAELHIIGRAGWGDEGQRIASHPGVVVHGYLPSDCVKAVIESADIYLCTSHDEGLGLPLLEAQFAGLPVVAPDKPVFREVLVESGTFVPADRPAEVAAAIHNLMAKPGWRDDQAISAMTNVRRWNALAARDLETARTAFSPDPKVDARVPAFAGGSVL
jgi:glycosyltransferase involved in cell wall biosynthesis